jgi:hypothetical protein
MNAASAEERDSGPERSPYFGAKPPSKPMS